LVEKLLQADPTFLFTIIEFNSNAKTLYSRGSDCTAIIRTVDKIRATNSTCFSNAFKEVYSNIHNTYTTTATKEDVIIVFFTDGCDVDRIKDRPAEIQKLKEILERDTAAAALHTIGFTSSHDARLLGEITTIGTTQGTFQYVASADKIKTAIDSLIEVLSTQGPSVVAKLSVNPISTPIEPFEKKVFFFTSAGR
jgi:hypothetical protein